MSVRRQSIFFNPQGPLADYFSEHPIVGWYFVSIKPPPKKTFMSSISGMFSSKPPAGTTLYHGPEPYYLFEKDESRSGNNDFKETGFRHVEIPISEIDLNGIITTEEDRLKIQTGGLRKKSRKTKKSRKSKKSRKVRHH